jgi:myosin protein heavy chain
VDLETKGYSGSAGKDVRFLHGRIQEVRWIHPLLCVPG